MVPPLNSNLIIAQKCYKGNKNILTSYKNVIYLK
nr:MAG TPA: hypothetical protein [Caudoviricetes sp.]